MAADRRLWFTHKCRFCSYLFVCEKDLVCHEATQHDAPNFVCDNCSCVFDDADQLGLHVNDGCSVADSSSADIGGRQHVCGACGEIFRFVRELYRHYGERHMDDRSGSTEDGKPDDVIAGAAACVCADCGAMFSGSASLKVHLWKAHSLNVAQQRDHILASAGRAAVRKSDSASSSRRRSSSANGQRDKPFKCAMCNWSFKYDFSFRAHLRMHAEKQRLLEEMVRANCGSQPTVDEVAPVDAVEPDTAVTGSSAEEVSVPIVLLPLKRKLDNGDDVECCARPNVNVVCNASCSTSSCYLTTGSGVDCLRQVGSGTSSGQYSVHRALSKSLGVSRVSSELIYSSLSPVTTDIGSCETAQSTVDDYAPCGEEPLRFACKLCGFKCRYDFSYIAHLNQHDKLKELEIDDLQSHLVASSSQMPLNSHALNRFAIQVIGSDHGGVSCVEERAPVVDSTGISYILLCPGAVDQAAVVTGLPQQQGSVVPQPSVVAECLDSGVVFVDDVNTSVGERDMDSATRAPPSDVDVDFGVGSEMQFLNSTGDGEAISYVVSESSEPVVASTDAATAEHRQKPVVCEEDAETEVVLPPEPSEGQLLDVASLCSDDDGHSDDAEEDSFTCYYCNAVFSRKSPLQHHILQLHVD